jgi:hypothetical protein
MEKAAIADEALIVDDDEWIITGWGERQTDKGAASRMRRYRERQQQLTDEEEEQSGSAVTAVTRNARNVTPTETKTETEKKEKSAKPKKHPIPNDWTPQESHADKAQAERVDLNREAERFRHHHAAKGSTYVDWDRAFHTWLMRAHDFGNHTTDSKPPPQGAGFY